MTLRLNLINKIAYGSNLKKQINHEYYNYLKNNICPIIHFKVCRNIKEIIDNVVYTNIHNIMWTHSNYNLKRFNFLNKSNKSNILKEFK